VLGTRVSANEYQAWDGVGWTSRTAQPQRRVPFLGEESAARRGVGVILWAAQLEIAQALAGELVAREAEGCFVIEPWWRGLPFALP